MKIQINEYKNNQLISSREKGSTINELKDLDLSELCGISDYVELVSTATKRLIIYSMFLKNSDTSVSVSADGVFFYFTLDGEEEVLDLDDQDWELLPVGSYHEQILPQLDYSSIEVILK